VSRYQKGTINLDFTEARDSGWQWHRLGHMQACTSLQSDNHVNNPLLSFFTDRMPLLPSNQQRQSTEGPFSVYIRSCHVSQLISLSVQISLWRNISTSTLSPLSGVRCSSTVQPTVQKILSDDGVGIPRRSRATYPSFGHSRDRLSQYARRLVTVNNTFDAYRH